MRHQFPGVSLGSHLFFSSCPSSSSCSGLLDLRIFKSKFIEPSLLCLFLCANELQISMVVTAEPGWRNVDVCELALSAFSLALGSLSGDSGLSKLLTSL